MSESFIDEGRIVCQQNRKCTFLYSVQGCLCIVPALFIVETAAGGKTEICAGNIKGPVIPSGPAGKIPSPSGTGTEMAVAYDTYGCRFQHVCNIRQSPVIFMVAVAEINAIGNQSGSLHKDLPALRKPAQLIEEIPRNFQAVDYFSSQALHR